MTKIVNVTVKCPDSYDADHVGEIIAQSVNECNTDHGFVNLVKIHIGHLSYEQIKAICDNVRYAFEARGVDNAIFVPIPTDLTDITVEEVRVTYGLD